MKKGKAKGKGKKDDSSSEFSEEDEQTAESYEQQVRAILKKNQKNTTGMMNKTAPRKKGKGKPKQAKQFEFDDDSDDEQIWDKPSPEKLAEFLKAQKWRPKKAVLDKKTLTYKYLQNLVKSAEYWYLGRVLCVVKKFLSKELSDIYFNSIKYKLNLQKQLLILERVNFDARELKPQDIRLPAKDQDAHMRQGYAIAEMTDFYDALKNQNMLIKTIHDFKTLILPIFYLLHGEAYDSDDYSTMTSYIVNPSKSQCNIVCLKCRPNKCNTACMEFLYHNTQYNKAKQSYEPIDITVNTRGTPFNCLHYLTSHGFYGLVPQYDQQGQIQTWQRMPVGSKINGMIQRTVQTKPDSSESMMSNGPKISSVQTDQYGQIMVSNKRSIKDVYQMYKDDYQYSSEDEYEQLDPSVYKRRKPSY